MAIGKRVAGNPEQLPTAPGYLGFRRGEIKGMLDGQFVVEFDLVGREKKKKVRALPPCFLVSEVALDRWIVENKICDPYFGQYKIKRDA